jgi:hypothetical protein
MDTKEALFIATVAVYAVTSHGVSRRGREMNIRVECGLSLCLCASVV